MLIKSYNNINDILWVCFTIYATKKNVGIATSSINLQKLPFNYYIIIMIYMYDIIMCIHLCICVYGMHSNIKNWDFKYFNDECLNKVMFEFLEAHQIIRKTKKWMN